MVSVAPSHTTHAAFVRLLLQQMPVSPTESPVCFLPGRTLLLPGRDRLMNKEKRPKKAEACWCEVEC